MTVTAIQIGLHPDAIDYESADFARFSGLTREKLTKANSDNVAGLRAAGYDVDNCLIDSGEATVSSKGVHLATLGPGDYFGEIALIDGGPRSATVTAATDLVCYGLTFWEFRPLIEGNGAIGWKLLQALAKRLRAADPS